MVSKKYIKKELDQFCVGLCDSRICDDYTCGSHPRYNWLNPIEPLMEDRQ